MKKVACLYADCERFVSGSDFVFAFCFLFVVEDDHLHAFSFLKLAVKLLTFQVLQALQSL